MFYFFQINPYSNTYEKSLLNLKYLTFNRIDTFANNMNIFISTIYRSNCCTFDNLTITNFFFLVELF